MPLPSVNWDDRDVTLLVISVLLVVKVLNPWEPMVNWKSPFDAFSARIGPGPIVF
jgi:hypothetical protein